MGRMLLFAGALFALWGCGGSSGYGTTATSNPSPTPTPTAAGRVITISGMAFSPVKLQVAPGETVTVEDRDSVPHTVTSETTPGAFTPGAVAGVSFDVSLAGAGASASFVIPAAAPVGTVIPYYCRVHTSTMATPTGEIEVVASPSSGQDGGAAPQDGGTTPVAPMPGY